MTTYDSQWASTRNLMHFSGVHGSAKMVDERHYAWASAGLAVSNNVQLFGENTLRCGGTYSQYVSRAENINVGVTDFCIEMWIYPEINPGNTAPIVWCLAAAAASAAYITVNGTLAPNKFAFYCGTFSTTVPLLTSTSNAALNTWAHIAIVRKNYVWTLYVNGVAEATVTNSTITINAAATLFIGSGSSANQGFMGYLADYRFTQGHWRYDGAFTPPTERLPHGEFYDADYDKVVLHCHFNSENGGNTFVDQKGHTISQVGSPTMTTADARFGGSAYQGGGVNGRYMEVNHADLNMGSGDFTVEMWFKPVLGASDPRGMFSFLAADGTTLALAWDRWASGGQASNTYIMGAATAPSLVSNTGTAWYHLAVVRDGGTIRAYMNGVQSGASTTNVATLNFNGVFRFGGRPGAYADNGTIDEIRVTKGLCRYKNGTTFTPPTEPFPDFTIQKLSGVVLDQASAPLARTVRSYRSSDGMLVDTTVSDAGTGAFTLRATDVSEHFVLVQDPTKNAVVYDHITPVV